MICAQCQAENSLDAAFCDACGWRLETACPNCGESNRGGAKFCKNCGQVINQPQPTVSSAVQRFPSPDTYVPPHLAEKILASRHTLEGERKQVTVLFADIRGSTSLLEGLDPEEAQKIIDPVLRVMMESVHRYEGTVNQVLGDGIMALFGAPVAHEDHALRACYAALTMQEDMRRYAEKVAGSHELKIGVGLNSGEVVVRSISNDLNLDYSAIGHSTYLAARMEEIAAPGSIMLAAATLREVEGFVQVKSLGALAVKGFSRPVETCELVGVTAVRKRLQAAAARGLTGFVGRSREVDVFSRVLGQAKAGHGQILALVGEPGMGKSRLAYEFIHSYLPPDWTVLEGTSVSYGKATPYYPLIELIRHYFQIQEAEAAESVRAKVKGHLLRLDERLKETIPPILALLDALPDYKKDRPIDTPTLGEDRQVVEAIKRFHYLEPRQRRRATFDALKRVLIRESQKQPLILLMEDLHWIDSETQAFLDSLVESMPMARILLLVNYRPGYSHTWAGKTYYTLLRVDPLPATGADELLQLLLGDEENLDPLKEVLIKRTEGNPFFLEECVRSLVESGALVGEKGAYRLLQNTQTITIPSTVQTALADRIDRLAIEEKRLLQTAAVIGVKVPLRLLRVVAELPEETLYRYLSNLQSAEFLYESNLFPELEYTFKHALTNEVVYGALLHEPRTSLHGRIVGVLEDIAGENLQDYIETLAHHALRGELWDKAVVYSREAGAKAMLHSGFTEALSRYEQASNALKHLPESRQKLEQDIDLHLEARNALFLLGDLSRIAEHLHAAESLVETLGDRNRTVRVFNFLNSYYGLSGDPELAIRFGQRASALISESDGPALSVMTDYYLGAAYNKLGQYSQAINVLKRAIRSLVGDLQHERFSTAGYPAVTCRGHLIQCLAATGQFREGVSYAEEGIKIAEEVGDVSVLVYVNSSLGVLYLVKGDLDKAIPILERALTMCRLSNVPVYVPFVSSRLGFAYATAGRIAEALPFLEQGVEDSASAGRLAFLSLSTTWLSEGHLLSGHLEKADVLAERALKIARKYKEHAHEAWALKLLADIALHRDPPNTEQAEAHYRQAFTLSNEIGMRPLEAHCHVGLGHVCVARGSLDQARAELSAAIDLYRSMEMTFWLNRVEAALRNMGM
jgi:class 3 adenylate cyclase/tetratricopeptide (TPR) repeat protein/KaiC/GvpD/RAD55 family RecA-like ATPase